MVRLEELTRHTSPYLLCWIDLAMTPRRLVDVGQLRQVKRLAERIFRFPTASTQKGSWRRCRIS